MQEQLTESETKQRRSNRFTLLLFVLVFLAPVVAAYLALYTGWWKTQGTTNKGHLYNPPMEFSQLKLRDEDGNPFRLENHPKTWFLMYIAPSDCDQACRNSLFQMRSSHIALGADQTRVKRLVVLPHSPDERLNTLLEEKFQNVLVAYANADTIDKAMQPAATDKQPASEAGKIFIVDPLGAIMLSYPAIADEKKSILKGRDILDDLERLLKVSRIG